MTYFSHSKASGGVPPGTTAVPLTDYCCISNARFTERAAWLKVFETEIRTTPRRHAGLDDVLLAGQH